MRALQECVVRGVEPQNAVAHSGQGLHGRDLGKRDCLEDLSEQALAVEAGSLVCKDELPVLLGLVSLAHHVRNPAVEVSDYLLPTLQLGGAERRNVLLIHALHYSPHYPGDRQ